MHQKNLQFLLNFYRLYCYMYSGTQEKYTTMKVDEGNRGLGKELNKEVNKCENVKVFPRSENF